MKTYETLLANEKTFASSNETRNAQCTNKRTRMYVACFEEIFEAIKTSERVGMFNAEYSDTKSRDKSIDVTYARIIDTSDNKSFIQLYGKENGKSFDIVFTNKYHEHFEEVFGKKYGTRFKYDSAHCIKYCAYEEVVDVISTIQSVLSAEKHVKTLHDNAVDARRKVASPTSTKQMEAQQHFERVTKARKAKK